MVMRRIQTELVCMFNYTSAFAVKANAQQQISVTVSVDGLYKLIHVGLLPSLSVNNSNGQWHSSYRFCPSSGQFVVLT